MVQHQSSEAGKGISGEEGEQTYSRRERSTLCKMGSSSSWKTKEAATCE